MVEIKKNADTEKLEGNRIDESIERESRIKDNLENLTA